MRDSVGERGCDKPAHYLVWLPHGDFFAGAYCQSYQRSCPCSCHRRNCAGNVCNANLDPVVFVTEPVDLNEHIYLPFIMRFELSQQSSSKSRVPRGVVAKFAPKAGTGAGRRVQDMSELEIFG